MEFIVVCAIIGVLFFAFRSKPRKTRRKPSVPMPPPEPRDTKAPLAGAENPQPPRFDAESASHPRETLILTGPAYITDGDTIKIKRTQIRLFGVDAPELNHPYGKKAKWALHALCEGQIIRAEIIDEDRHGRTVAHCYLPDGRDLSAEMVKQGMAIDWPKFSKGKYRIMETPDARKKLFLADARQKGQMHVWRTFEAKQGKR